MNKGCISRLKIVSVLLLIIFITCSAGAQKFSHQLNFNTGLAKPDRAAGKFKILAVMVQFKTDKDTLTSGDGRFDLSDRYKDTTVDAPPHNRQYFVSHLKFLKNYYSKVSDGKVEIEYYIPDKIYTLPDSMRRYSPPKGTDYTKLADLSVDAWTLVDKESPEIVFSDYDCFFIFHAGSGKDIDLASIYGSDPTPFDLPSITFNLTSFKKYYGSSYQGIPVNGGKFKIQNSAVLPESEYREIKSYGVTNLVELSINGLIVSSFASYLGLPDLFNTKDGTTAIGRFGLMDGQAIFSYNGLFPPSPSAWEKVYLGWVNPIIVNSGINEFSISAPRTDGISANAQIYKIPITNKEYFLVECRYRDPGNNGLTVKSEVRGTEKEYHINKDTTYFDQFGTVSLVSGVVTDVDDYDWSLPGGFDYKKNKLNGGMLIWHIDESKIESGLADNSINNNIDHRGVDLEEADGSQDIGQTYGMLSSGSSSENGTPLDFWYNDLNYYAKDSLLRPVYKNIFSNTSNPNSKSYYGANSHISIYDISTQNPVMSFKVKIGDDAVSLLKGYPVKLSLGGKIKLSNADIKVGNSHQLITNPNGILSVYNVDGVNSLSSDLNSVNNFSIFKETSKTDKIVLDRGTNDHKLQIYDLTNSPQKLFDYDLSNSSVDSFFIYTLKSNSYAGSRVNVLNKTKGVLNQIGYSNNNFYFYKADTINKLKPVDKITSLEVNSTVGNRNFYSVTENSIYVYNTELIKFRNGEKIKNFIVGNITNPNYLDIAYLFYNPAEQSLTLNCFSDIDGLSSLSSREPGEYNSSTKKIFSDVCNVCWDHVSPFVVGDIDNDKISDFVFSIYDKLYVFNKYGTLLDNFPVRFKQGTSDIKPVIADINGDSRNEIIVCSEDGSLFAFNEKGKLMDGYPISIGSKPLVTPVFFKVKDSIGLAVINSDGYLYAWKLNGRYNPDKIAWSGDYANERMSGSQTETKELLTVKSSEYLPKSRAYNYPNPVYNDITQIRFFVSENSNVKIRIFDLSGEKVHEISTTGVAGMDNDVEWNVKDVQSGIYLAQIEADSGGNKSSVIIKIAVIK